MANGAFTKGTGTLQSDDLIKAFAEACMLLQTEETDALANQQAILDAGLTVPNFVTINIDLDSDTMTINVTDLPIETTVSNGGMLVNAKDYLLPLATPAPTIDNTLNVDGADIVSTTKAGAVLELALLINSDEANDSESDNNLTLTVDSDNGTAEITATFSGAGNVSSTGTIEFIPDNYLAA